MHLRFARQGAGFLFLSLVAASCSDDDPKKAAPLPSIAISSVTATRTSVSFTLTPENAVSYAYACVPETEQATAAMIRVDGAEAGPHTVPNLDPGTDYVVLATATNADGKTCATVTQTVSTRALPTLSFGEFTVGSHEASVTVTSSGAEGFRWYCLEHGSEAPDDPAATEVVFEGEEAVLEIMTDGGGNPLKGSTAYDVHALPFDDEGPGETVTATFTTAEAIPVQLTIDEVKPNDILFSVTMDPSVCDMYMVAAGAPIIIDMIDWEEELMWNGRWVESRGFSATDDELATVRPGETYKIAVAPCRRDGYNWIPMEEAVVTLEVTTPAQ